MLLSICSYFLLFLLYSVIGYIVEVFCVSILNKKLVLNRGYLIGPYIPIYGIGAMMMLFFLSKYKNDIFVLFIMSIFICTALEYITSFLMEKIFKLRWWDYSEKKFNINGRVCLENGILFGLGGVLVVKIINPYLENIIFSLPKLFNLILGITLMIIFTLDFIESTYITFRLKINVSKYANKDATRAIKKEVMKSLHKNTLLTTRLINAFPHIEHITNYNFNDFKNKIAIIKKEKRIIKEKNRNQKKKIKTRIRR